MGWNGMGWDVAVRIWCGDCCLGTILVGMGRCSKLMV